MKVLHSIPSNRYVLPQSSTEFAICMDGDASTYLRCQLDIDLSNKERGWNQGPYYRDQLLELKKLLPAQACNVILTHDERNLVMGYTLRQWKIAFDCEDILLEDAYTQLIDALFPATKITFKLY